MVYGIVALIVKADDFGVFLIKKDGVAETLGKGILFIMPKFYAFPKFYRHRCHVPCRWRDFLCITLKHCIIAGRLPNRRRLVGNTIHNCSRCSRRRFMLFGCVTSDEVCLKRKQLNLRY